MNRVVLAVDGNSLVHRSFHAQAKTNLRDGAGRPMWAVRGLLSQLVAAVDRIGPDAVIVGFDDPAASERRTTWPHYKAARSEKLPTLIDQLQRAADVLSELGIAVVSPPGLEADDVLASVAAMAPRLGAETVIMTSDRDSFALIDEHTRVLRILNGGVEASPLLDTARLEMMLGIRPEQYRDFAALRGDPSDNLSGVHGIGAKTAARLLSVMQSAHDAFADVAAGGARVSKEVGAAVAQRLAHPDAHATWQQNCEIMQMRVDVDVAFCPSTGPGLLPLNATKVRSTWAQHQLTATLSGALRVLCREESSTVAPPVRVVWPPHRQDVDVAPFSDRPPLRTARQPRRAPAAASAVSAGKQLSLF